MDDRHERWPDVGRAITARIAELSLTYAELRDRSGISFKTLKAYMAGQPIKRDDKRRELQRALEWPGDAIDRILAGEQIATASAEWGGWSATASAARPAEAGTQAPGAGSPEQTERIARLEHRVDELAATLLAAVELLEAQTPTLAAVLQHVEALRSVIAPVPEV